VVSFQGISCATACSACFYGCAYLTDCSRDDLMLLSAEFYRNTEVVFISKLVLTYDGVVSAFTISLKSSYILCTY
jgi:hypothetical protein